MNTEPFPSYAQPSMATTHLGNSAACPPPPAPAILGTLARSLNLLPWPVTTPDVSSVFIFLR